ncbi:hypothetical protein EX30DRAFT_324087 [Ascodesmis nigricans]|uniref:Cofilin n=1 Tax=Ascodesmis nigricans TaxID=341454 RepID=A0A4S2MQV6_9PEZI|nr:hypothetical protein EX30DRAFT_324087 [Ascodesmis nigricans]
MSRSGVGLSAECVPLFEQLKSRKLKYIIYRLSDDKKTIIKEKTSEDDDLHTNALPKEEEAYEKFLAALPELDCRYAIYDFEFDVGEGKRSKICFFTWSPDDAPVKAKMIYSSSKDGLRRALAGVHTEIQGTDFSEVAYETVLEKASRGR